RAVQRAIEHGESFDLELEITTAKGNRRSVHTVGKADLPARRVYGFFQDVTQAKLAEAALRESETRFQQLFQTMEEGFATHEIICDSAGRPVDYRFLDVNPAFERLTGLKKQDIVGKTVLEVMPDTEKVWIDNYGQVALGGTPMSFESTSGPLGKCYEVRAFSPERGKFAVTFFDVTERKLARLKLEKLNQDLSDKKQEMENFLYITTHDLRSPLVNIQGFSQNLRTYLAEFRELLARAQVPPAEKDRVEKLLNEKIPETLAFVLGGSQKMDALITALLKVSRVGRVEMRPEKLDTAAVINKNLAALRFQLETSGGAVHLGALPPCYADPGAVSQLFANLLDNAIKYRHPDRSPEIRVSGETRGAVTVYTVADNGAGIPGTDLARIWNVFYHPEHATERKGEGIGLPMVRRLVEKNGGSIRAESKLGEGTVFYVELPAAGGGKHGD
ncbi:MAG: ATP-binding protein, partial [Elusimicrobiales bacterium]|nr:ATP-binding protein [Elusimicrobiales bacterium]